MSEIISQETLDDLNGRFLTFYIGRSIYGIELLHVIEIIKIQSITQVPGVPHYVKGIINLRGKIVPVIDVRLKLDQEPRDYDDKTCIVVVIIDDMQVGLIVDSVSEVANIDASTLSQPPELSNGYTNSYLKSVSQIGEKVILNLDCDKFFQSELAATKF